MTEYAEQVRDPSKPRSPPSLQLHLSGVSGLLLFDSRTGQRVNDTIRVWTTSSNGRMEQVNPFSFFKDLFILFVQTALQISEWSGSEGRFIMNISTHGHSTQKKKKTLENHTLSVTVYLVGLGRVSKLNKFFRKNHL